MGWQEAEGLTVFVCLCVRTVYELKHVYCRFVPALFCSDSYSECSEGKVLYGELGTDRRFALSS